MAKNRPSHISKPVYPGGITAMQKFLRDNLKYPEQAKAAALTGTVTIRYSVDYRGKVVDAKVKKSLGYGCDEEAVRVVKLMRFSVPQDRKKKVRIHQDINIHFNATQPNPAPAAAAIEQLTKEPEVAQSADKTPVSIHYVTASSTIKGKLTSNKDKPGKGKTSYGYTIEW